MKYVRKNLIVMVVLIIGLFSLAGCENRITPADVQALASQQQTLQTQVDEAQALAAKLTADMQAAGIVDPNLTAKIAEISIQADKWQEQANAIGKAIADVKLTGDTNTDWIAVLRAANAASSPVNPYAPLIDVGLLVATGICGWLARKKAAEAAAAQAKYQAHKQGVEKTMKEVSASTIPEVKAVESQLYNNIGTARANNGI